MLHARLMASHCKIFFLFLSSSSGALLKLDKEVIGEKQCNNSSADSDLSKQLYLRSCRSTISSDKASFCTRAFSNSSFRSSCNFIVFDIFLSVTFCCSMTASISDFVLPIFCCSSDIFPVLSDFFLLQSAKQRRKIDSYKNNSS